MHTQFSTAMRKSPARAAQANANARQSAHDDFPRPALPCRGLRAQIWEAAKDMLACGDSREISSVLASRFRVAETVVDRILVVEGVTHERGRAALASGIKGALSIEAEAVRSVDDDYGSAA